MRRPLSIVLVIVSLAILINPIPHAQAQTGTRYFAQTGHNVSGKFLTYWNQHGGLAQQGYPISEQMQEVSNIDGNTYTVQYFERAEFQLHPENQPPNDVELALLGSERLQSKYPSGNPTFADASMPGYFPQTQHTLTGRFLAYWKSHGGLAQQGYPITEPFSEKSDVDGNTYTVQYFERAVFELHPENQAPNDVLLSLLGKFSYNDKYSNVSGGGNPPPATPVANNPPPTPTSGDTGSTSPNADIKLMQYTHFYTPAPFHNLVFIGIVKNTGAQPATNININLTLYDASGGVIGTGSDITLGAAVLPPGRSAGFILGVASPPSSWSKEDIKTPFDTYDPATNGSYYTALSISGVTLAPSSSGGYVIRGSVKNDGNSIATLVSVVAAGYDAGGKVVDVDQGFVADNKLAPGATSTFEINLYRQPTKRIVSDDLIAMGFDFGQ